MKKIIISTIAFILISSFAFAQAPGKFNYQAVIRDGSGNAVASQSVTLQFQIYDAIAGGNLVYQEDISSTTNAFGVVNLSIGGNPTIGNLKLLNWSSNIFYVQILIGSTALGPRAQLLSVPYSLQANKADTAKYALAAPVQATTVSISGGQLTVNGVSASLPVSATPTVQRLTAVGNGTYTTPAGVKYIEVEMLGGGGGGGGGSHTYPGGGGGAGGYLKFLINNPSATYAYTIGDGGAGGAANTRNDGVNGSNTVFGLNVAGGGSTTSNSQAGAGGTNTFFTGIEIVNMQGNGGSAYSGGAIAYQTGGSGGTGFFGGGASSSNGTAANGGSGTANSGSGGVGGSGSGTGSSGGAGGKGGSGVIIVKEFYQ